MKLLFLTLLLILSACSEFTLRNPAALQKHIVFDIDWTIVSEIKNPDAIQLKNPRVIKVHDHFYYINDGLEEFVEDILRKGDVKVSFYSGGELIRNQELLKKIKLKSGQSLFEIAYKIKGREDLVSVTDAPAGARFAERYKKDLKKIADNLEELIMFDDTLDFALDESINQNKHVFYIGKAFLYFEKFESVKGASGEYIPSSKEEWLLNREKLNILRGAFNDAYTEAQSKGISFSEAMKKREELLNLKDHQWNDYSSQYYKASKGIPLIRSNSQNCSGMVLEVMLNHR